MVAKCHYKTIFINYGGRELTLTSTYPFWHDVTLLVPYVVYYEKKGTGKSSAKKVLLNHLYRFIKELSQWIP